MMINTSTLTKDIFYVGVTVKDEEPVDSDKLLSFNDTDPKTGLSLANLTIGIGTYSASCLFFNKTADRWVGGSCIVSPFSSLDTIQCWCHHLSVLAGGFSILPHNLNFLTDSMLFVTFFSNPIIVSVVIYIWVMYFLILAWACHKDKKDLSKAGIHILQDNKPKDKYMYLVGVVTGWWRNAGTTANVYITVEGTKGLSTTHVLSDGNNQHFYSGSEDWFLMTTPNSLGKIKYITVWHDNSGRNPSWYLRQVIIKDVQTEKTWHFVHDNWLGLKGNKISLKVDIPAITPEELKELKYYQFSLKSSQGLKNNHLWISIVCKSENAMFTRAQRLTCALSLLLTTMLTSIMFHGVPEDDVGYILVTEVITFSLQDIIIGLESGLITFLINLLIVQLFTRVSPRPKSLIHSKYLPSSKTKNVFGNSKTAAVTVQISHMESDDKENLSLHEEKSKIHRNENIETQDVENPTLDGLDEQNGSSKTFVTLQRSGNMKTQYKDNSSMNFETEDSKRIFSGVQNRDSRTSGIMETNIVEKPSLNLQNNANSETDASFKSSKNLLTEGMEKTNASFKRSKNLLTEGMENQFLDVPNYKLSKAGISRQSLENLDNMHGIESQLLFVQNDESKQVKKEFRFPWWVVYIAWAVVIMTSVVSSYFVMLYGLKYGYQKSIDWLVSFLTAFFQSTLVTQPLKVISISILLTIILKRPIEFENLDAEEMPELGEGEEYVQKDLLKAHGIILDTAPDTTYVKQDFTAEMMQKIREKLEFESRIAMIVRDLVVYFTYVFMVLFMVYGHRNVSLQYLCTKNIEDMFIHPTSYSGDILFQKVSTINDIYKYLDTNIVPNLIRGKMNPVSNRASYMLGSARLRQKRQIPDSCGFPIEMIHLFPTHHCLDKFSWDVEETRSFNKSWSNPARSRPVTFIPDQWSFQSAWQLRTIPYAGTMSVYSGSGYVYEIPNEQTNAIQSLKKLHSEKWIDERTSSLFVEFTLYNPNVNFFSVVMLLFEFTTTGAIVPYHQIFTSKLYHYNNEFEIFVAVCEVIFVIVTLMCTYYEIKRYHRLKRREYFSDLWNCVEVVIIGLSYSIIGIFFQRLVTVHLIIHEYKLAGPDRFTSFYTAIFWDFLLGYLMAALVGLVMIKILKVFNFYKPTKILPKTIKNSWKSVLSFTFKIAVFIIAFCQFGVLTFGRNMYSYHTMTKSFLTIINFLLGFSDFYGLDSVDRTMGLVFYFLAYAVLQYILISVFVSVILFSFKETRRQLKNDEEESVVYHIYRYITVLLGFKMNK